MHNIFSYDFIPHNRVSYVKEYINLVNTYENIVLVTS